tara:strand:+ start:81 stop:314 length:234 start_codon:yes stop_codon:yes gene_type:complete
MDSAKEFISKIGASPELQEAVNALQGTGVLARMVDLGVAHGYTFTEDEYRAAVVDLADGALSDEALDEVLREAGFEP